MEFFPRELCEKLVKLGCVSESQFVWSYYDEPICSKDATFTIYLTDETQAFIEQDFTGCLERARENARLVKPGSWISQMPCPDNKPGCLVYHSKQIFFADEWRHAMIDHKGSAAEFVAKGLEGRI